MDKHSSAMNRTAMVPNMITTGNAVCGFIALAYIAASDFRDGQFVHPEYLRHAAWLILAGMVFDVFDGRVARLTGGTSDFGAQLDSLADLVTFGLAPAGLVISLNRVVSWQPAWQKITWVFGLAYFLGAILRLARFNAEHDESEEAHLCFKGIPTPAAAGTVAGLVLVYFWLSDWSSWELRTLSHVPPEWVAPALSIVPALLPFVAFMLGFAMVSSRLIYPHVASHFFARRNSFDTFVYLLFGVLLAVVMVEPILCLLFLGYMLWTPLTLLFGAVNGVVKRAN